MPKIDKVEFEKRIRIVMEWIIEDWPSCDIITNIGQKWGVEQRQAKRYIAEARKRWGKQEDLKIEAKLHHKILSLKKLKLSLKEEFRGTPKGIRAILSVEKELIVLEKMKPPTKFELGGKNGEPLEPLQQIVYVKDSNVDYEKLSDSVLEAIVKARKKNDD